MFDHFTKMRKKLEPETVSFYRNTSLCMEASESLHAVGWDYAGSSWVDSPIDSMECHTLSVVLDRFLIFIEGWGGAYSNKISVLDGDFLPELQVVSSVTKNVPATFRYSYSTVVIEPQTLLMYGGFFGGGYRADTNEAYFIELSLCEKSDLTKSVPFNRNIPTLENMQIIANYSSVLNCSGAEAVSRGFHSATALYLRILFQTPSCPKTNSNEEIQPSQFMLVWGGIHHGSPIGCLQALELNTMTWINVTTTGAEPSPRFGHSCNVINKPGCRYTSLVIVGGSDGSDLWRSGKDLKEIHVLHIVPGADRFTQDCFVWSTPNLQSGPSFDSTHLPLHFLQSDTSFNSMSTLDEAELIPGRCHTSCVIGNNIITFGGGAQVSNLISVIDTTGMSPDQNPPQNGILVIRRPFSTKIGYQCSPTPRTAGVGAAIGHWFFVQGGWNQWDGELAEISLLDLTVGKTILVPWEHTDAQELSPLSLCASV